MTTEEQIARRAERPEAEERPALDLLDFCFLVVGAAYPPLLLLAVGEWLLRRNPAALQWVEQRIAGLIPASPPALSLPAPVAPVRATEEPQHRSRTLFERLGDAPHILVVGHTGGGKTTLMHALARHLARGASVVVCDPDAIAGNYPGYRVVGAGDDYEAIGRALTLASNEVARRRDQRKQGQREFPPMWVLIDEAHDIFGSVEGARDIAEGIIRRGRKLEVHCVLGTQDAQVRTLGLSGKSELLKNLLRVDVRRAGNGREAVIEGEPWRVPDLPSPDEMQQRPVAPRPTRPASLVGSPEKRPASPEKSPASPEKRPASPESLARPVGSPGIKPESPDSYAHTETPKNLVFWDDEASLLLVTLLMTSPGQSEGIDSIWRQPTTRQTTSNQSETAPSLPDRQEILTKLDELGTRTKVWEDWLRPVYGIGSKARGMKIIGEAEAAQRQGGQK